MQENTCEVLSSRYTTGSACVKGVFDVPDEDKDSTSYNMAKLR